MSAWKHGLAHFAQEAAKTDTGKQVAAAALGTAVAVGKGAVIAAAAAPVLPIAAVGAAAYGAYRLLRDK